MSIYKSLAIGLLLSMPAPGILADEFGTLFTTAAQRTKLDNGVSDTGSATGEGAGGTAQSAKTTRPLKLNGTLIGKSGRKEVWINGQPEIHNSKRKHPRVNLVRNGSVHFKPSAAGVPRLMKPGQVYDPQTGTVSESYQQNLSTESKE
ncbi:MAG: hypothetical protein BMS9Abin09_0763 [Gammaproteobacteria bacterium]|nr:MAG: hypothetical protein BMS9Abin09_0763 [Gammaproteobacteria bacterium]